MSFLRTHLRKIEPYLELAVDVDGCIAAFPDAAPDFEQLEARSLLNKRIDDAWTETRREIIGDLGGVGTRNLTDRHVRPFAELLALREVHGPRAAKSLLKPGSIVDIQYLRDMSQETAEDCEEKLGLAVTHGKQASPNTPFFATVANWKLQISGEPQLVIKKPVDAVSDVAIRYRTRIGLLDGDGYFLYGK